MRIITPGNIVRAYEDFKDNTITVCFPNSDFKPVKDGKYNIPTSQILIIYNPKFGFGKPKSELFENISEFNNRKRHLLQTSKKRDKKIDPFIEGELFDISTDDSRDPNNDSNLIATNIDLYGRGPNFGNPDVPEDTIVIRGEYKDRYQGWQFTAYTKKVDTKDESYLSEKQP